MAKIAFIGDSNTAPRLSNGVSQSDTFSQKIAVARGFSYVVNAGVGGNTSAMMLARFSSDVVSTSPDHIVISPGINDQWAAVPPATYEANIRDMVDLAGSIPVTLMTPPLVRSTAYIDNIAPYNDAIKRVAADYEVPLVDLYFEFMQKYFTTLNVSPASFTNLYVDAQHVSALGHTFIKDVVTKPSNWRACRLPGD